MEKKIKVTQVRSMIGSTETQKATIKALGLGRPNYFIEQKDSKNLRGQIRKVAHLIKVEEIK